MSKTAKEFLEYRKIKETAIEPSVESDSNFTISSGIDYFTQMGTCRGCGRKEIHKMCPAWGTPYYMSGTVFTEELEKQYYVELEAAIKE